MHDRFCYTTYSILILPWVPAYAMNAFQVLRLPYATSQKRVRPLTVPVMFTLTIRLNKHLRDLSEVDLICFILWELSWKQKSKTWTEVWNSESTDSEKQARKKNVRNIFNTTNTNTSNSNHLLLLVVILFLGVFPFSLFLSFVFQIKMFQAKSGTISITVLLLQY